MTRGGWLQHLCDAVNKNLVDDVHIGVLNVLLQLSQTVAVADLSPDACKTPLFCCLFSLHCTKLCVLYYICNSHFL